MFSCVLYLLTQLIKDESPITGGDLRNLLGSMLPKKIDLFFLLRDLGKGLIKTVLFKHGALSVPCFLSLINSIPAMKLSRVYTYQLSKESDSEMTAAGRYNHNLQLHRKGIKYALDMGYNDDIYIWEDAVNMFVLNIRPTLSYIGLNIYSKPTERTTEVIKSDTSLFVQGDDQCEELFGIKNALFWRKPVWLFKAMLNHIGY